MSWIQNRIVAVLCALTLAAALPMWSLEAGGQPNIVYVMCDDLGWGEVHCYNPEHGKIQTPNVDRLAEQGMRFTDAHSGSSVCTPTRYGLLTGRYSWRTRLQGGVVQGYAPCLIAEDRPTVASYLKSHGYHTAIIGKWHLNNLYLNPETGKPYNNRRQAPPIGATLPDGPTNRGFDYFHGFHHSRHMQAVIENGEVIEHDEPINMLPRLTTKAVEYIEERGKGDKPFFLYVPLNSPHGPIVPSKPWQGKSGMGAFADFVMQTDHALGEICKALDRAGLTKNTIVIFTSDNGTSRIADFEQLAGFGHVYDAELRGSKADIWDGGHRVPFIVRWPGKVEPGSTSDQLICHTDLFATVAELIDQPLPENAAEDSVSFLPALHGRPIETTREGVIHHSISGHFAYRAGDWKLVLARGSGGWSSPKERQVPDDAPRAQLYNMGEDQREQNNLYLARPELAKRLLAMLEDDVTSGRSTDGPASSNDLAEVDLWKSEAGR